MELPKIFFGYFDFLGYLVTMATAFHSYLGLNLENIPSTFYLERFSW